MLSIKRRDTGVKKIFKILWRHIWTTFNISFLFFSELTTWFDEDDEDDVDDDDGDDGREVEQQFQGLCKTDRRRLPVTIPSNNTDCSTKLARII